MSAWDVCNVRVCYIEKGSEFDTYARRFASPEAFLKDKKAQAFLSASPNFKMAAIHEDTLKPFWQEFMAMEQYRGMYRQLGTFRILGDTYIFVSERACYDHLEETYPRPFISCNIL